LNVSLCGDVIMWVAWMSLPRLISLRFLFLVSPYSLCFDPAVECDFFTLSFVRECVFFVNWNFLAIVFFLFFSHLVFSSRSNFVLRRPRPFCDLFRGFSSVSRFPRCRPCSVDLSAQPFGSPSAQPAVKNLGFGPGS